MDTKDFVKKIRELDKYISKHSKKTDLTYETLESDAKQYWLKPIQELVDSNRNFIVSNLPEIRKYMTTSHRKFISPLFDFYINNVRYNSFPFDNIKEYRFKKLIRSIKELHRADEMQTYIDDFRTFIEHKDRYMFKKLFRPHHPLYYILNDIEASTASIEVEAQRTIQGLNPFLSFPQNKNTKDLQFALALAAGIPVQKLMSLKQVEPAGTWSIRFIDEEDEEGDLTLVYDSEKWARAFKYLKSCNTTKAQASQALSDVPLYMLGWALSYKQIPDFHQALIHHFHKENESLPAFIVKGEADLSAIISQYTQNTDQLLQEAEKNHPGIRAVVDEVAGNPEVKVTVLAIRDLLKVNQVTAQSINDSLNSIFAPLERRPSRSEKYPSKDLKKPPSSARKTQSKVIHLNSNQDLKRE